MTDRIITYSEAVREAIAQAMDADPNVFMLGEDIGIYGGAFGVSGDLYHRYGAERIRDTPISELGIVDNKASIVIAVEQILTSKFSAVEMVNEVSEILGGKGGGGLQAKISFDLK